MTREEVSVALNRAADEITVEADLPDQGAQDALNLMVNATLTYLDDPEADLQAVVRANYDDASLPEILDWIAS